MEGRSRTGPWLVLVALCLVVLVMRWHTYDEPFERDLNMYAVIGHELLEGRQLYADLYDQKPPAPYLTYAAAELVVGYGPAQMYLLGVAAALVTLLGLYYAESRTTRDPASGLWAAAFWVLVCSDLWLQANQPNTEVFINAALVWAFGLWVTSEGPTLDARRALAIGALLACASLYKHVAVVPAAFLAAAHVALPPAGRPRRVAAIEVGVIVAVGAAAWLGTFAWFAASGRAAELYETVVSYSFEYSVRRRGLMGNLLHGLRPEVLAPPSLRFAWVLAAPAVLAALDGLRRPEQRRLWVFWLALAAGTQIAVALPGRFAPHYYQLWLPVLVLGCALACWRARSLFAASRVPAGHGLAALVALALAAHAAPSYTLSADQWSVEKYGDGFVVTRDLGRRLDSLLLPQETLFEWGSEPGLYVSSGRRPISGVLNVRFALSYGGPLQERLTRRMLADLERAPPDLIVLEETTLRATPEDHPIYVWMDANYETFDRFDRFRLAARRDSDLARRQGLR